MNRIIIKCFAEILVLNCWGRRRVGIGNEYETDDLRAAKLRIAIIILEMRTTLNETRDSDSRLPTLEESRFDRKDNILFAKWRWSERISKKNRRWSV